MAHLDQRKRVQRSSLRLKNLAQGFFPAKGDNGGQSSIKRRKSGERIFGGFPK